MSQNILLMQMVNLCQFGYFRYKNWQNKKYNVKIQWNWSTMIKFNMNS